MLPAEVAEDKRLRTIFVGNLSLDTTRRELLRLFRPYGEVEKVRFRSVPLEQNKMSRRANFILGKIDAEGDCMHAYVTFREVAGARRARAEAPGLLFKEKHLRVTM